MSVDHSKSILLLIFLFIGRVHRALINGIVNSKICPTGIALADDFLPRKPLASNEGYRYHTAPVGGQPPGQNYS